MSFYTPSVIHESSMGLTRLSIADLMLQRREIWLSGEINSEQAGYIISQIFYLNEESPDKTITIYIDSPGGSVSAGLAIYDVMRAVSCDIRTVCVGLAASMAALLFAAGNHREILPHGEVMVHDPLVNGGISGSALVVHDKSGRLMQTRKTICGILAQHTGKNQKQI